MGALAGVVVSPRRRAVSGSRPGPLPLASLACRPGPVLLLPSGFGRCSAHNGEKKKKRSRSDVVLICQVFSIRFLFFELAKDFISGFFFPSSGQIWTETCGRGPPRGVGGRQVSVSVSFSTFLGVERRRKKVLTCFISFSLGLLDQLEDYEWRDTIQLYREKVRKD